MLLSAPCAASFEVEKPLPRVVLALEGGSVGMQAAYYAALERGLYREAGLDVRIVQGGGTIQAVRDVEEAKADLGTAEASAVLALRARGSPICIVAAVMDKSPLCVFSLKDAHISAPHDLAGKKVAYDRFADAGLLFPRFMRTVGLFPEDVTLVPMDRGQRLPSAVLGKIGAFLGTLLEKPAFEAVLPPDRLSVLLWADHGFDLCAACLYARETWALEHPGLVTAFLQASFQGWAWTLENPRDAARMLSTILPAADGGAIAAEIAALKPLIFTEAAKTEGMGVISSGRAAATLESMETDRGERLGPAAAGALPSGFLPDPPVLLGAPPAEEAAVDAAPGAATATPRSGVAADAAPGVSTPKNEGSK
jgi:NitT/TauT family transport system substrate-binding protein